MELDPEQFEKLSQAVQIEEKNKILKAKEVENKWARLEAKFGGINNK
jgi:hypothetical protein